MSTNLTSLVRLRRANYNLRKSPHINAAGTSRMFRDDPEKTFPENVWVLCEKLAERGIDPAQLSRAATEAWAAHFFAGGPEPAPDATAPDVDAPSQPPASAASPVISGPHGAEIELSFAIYVLLTGAISLAEYRDRSAGAAERMKKLNAIATEYLALSNSRSGSTDSAASETPVEEAIPESPDDTAAVPNPG